MRDARQRGNGRLCVFFPMPIIRFIAICPPAAARAQMCVAAYLIPNRVNLIPRPHDEDGRRRTLAPVHRQPIRRPSLGRAKARL
jgi:hypothetical protein